MSETANSRARALGHAAAENFLKRLYSEIQPATSADSSNPNPPQRRLGAKESQAMRSSAMPRFTKRYHLVTEEKAGGITFTPEVLSDYVARQIVHAMAAPRDRPLRVLDPAVGHGQLLVSLIGALGGCEVQVFGYETKREALETARARLREKFPNASIRLEEGNFLSHVVEKYGAEGAGSLFANDAPRRYDLVIANPPYVRTQVMGGPQARILAQQFGLTGRVDLYYAFLLAIGRVLEPNGIAGVIVSNRFMTTKSGASVRAAIRSNFNLRHVWDLGDSKIFDAAVLPAVVLLQGKNDQAPHTPRFTSIYESSEKATSSARNPIDALDQEGIIAMPDGRHFDVKLGILDGRGAADEVWRLASDQNDVWLATVQQHTWGTFRDIGKIRVGVKTCADKVFIRSDWDKLGGRPELLRPLTTHHIGRQYKAAPPKKSTCIFYPHESANGKRQPVDLDLYPVSRRYLDEHRSILEARKYVIEAGRRWYEVWVPQDSGSRCVRRARSSRRRSCEGRRLPPVLPGTDRASDAAEVCSLPIREPT
jgi:adenine-specific DNA-methyltransferase